MDPERQPTPWGGGLPPPPRDRELPPPPEPPPAPRSTVRIAVVLGVLFALGTVAGVGGAVYVGRGSDRAEACAGATFVSDEYGYCVDTPSGWTSWSAAEEPSGLDAFRAGHDDTVVYVEAVRLEGGQDLDAFAASTRATDTMNGYAVTDPVPGTLGGVPSLEWDAVTTAAGEEVVVREIVAVRGGVAWRLQITDVGSTGAPSLYEVRELLDTWRFV